MYCKKCGKFITYDALVCNECAEEMLKNEQGLTKNEQTYIEKPQTQTVQRGNIMEGFGKALASVIIPIVSIFCGIFAFIMGAAAYASRNGNYWLFQVGQSILFVLIIVCVVAIVLGAQSISLSNRLASEGKRRPIPTMVCGIEGLVSAIMVTIVLSIYLILLCAMPYMPTGG